MNRSVLYTTVSNGFALIRSGASRFLKSSRSWSLEGWPVDNRSPNALCPAYTLQELSDAKMKHSVDVEVTGNSAADIASAVRKIVSESMKEFQFPFRVYRNGKYEECGYGSSLQILLDPSGHIRMFRRTIRGIEEVNECDGIVVEPFTGYFDQHGVPIIDNDAVLVEGSIMRVSRLEGSWMVSPMDGSENMSRMLAVSRTSASVLGPSRYDFGILSGIAKLIKNQGKYNMPGWN